MKLKCSYCKLKFEKEDVRPLSFGIYECRNCAKDFISKKAVAVENGFLKKLFGGRK